MAIWMFAFGRNGLGPYDAQATAQYLEILHRIPFDEDCLSEYFVQPGSSFEAHSQKAWEVVQQSDRRVLFINTFGRFSKFDGLKVSVYNDVVRVSGPFEIFSNYSKFQQGISKELRDYFHQYFVRVLRAFGSDFIVYGHEWNIGEDDEFEYDAAGLLAYIAQFPRSASIHDMNADNEIYFAFI